MADRPKLRTKLRALTRDQRGATAVEYGLILALVVLGMMVGIVSLGGQTTNTWGNISSKVKAVTPQ